MKHDGMIWGFLIQLGHNMWREKPLAGEVEKHGSRPWIWSDKIWHDREEFYRKMPKSVMQCPWHYDRFWHFVRDNDEIRRRGRLRNENYDDLTQSL